MKKNRLPIFSLLLATLLLATACNSKDNSTGALVAPVEFHRFEQLIFSTPQKQLRSVLASDSAICSSPLLNCYPDDPDYIDYLGSFARDPYMRYIYRKTDSLYRDLSWLERDLNEAMIKAHELCPDIYYKHYYTLITADFETGYDTRVFCYDRELAISIDHYALPAMKDHNYFMTPAYIVGLCTREHILPDCMSAVAIDHITLPDGDLTLLDHAIYRGKILYFLDQVLPDIPEHIKIRYTPEQLEWMKTNIKNVWGHLIQNNLLFSTDKGELRNLIGEAPKTNAFGDGSAPRVCDYIGWQIVKSYMSHNRNVTLGNLLADTDSRKILNQSQWRPEEEESSSSNLLLWLLLGGGIVAAIVIAWLLLRRK